MNLRISHCTDALDGTLIAECADAAPRALTQSIEAGVRDALASLDSNFIGDAVIGRDVNFEAGSIVANHRNERDDKRIRVRVDEHLHTLDITRFGALVDQEQGAHP